MSTTEQRLNTKWRWLLAAVLMLAASYVLAVNVDKLQASFVALANADLTLTVLAFAIMLATFCIAALVYQLLALRPLRFTRTVCVEMAAASVNRLLPAGAAGLGLLGLYLYRQKHNAAQATAIVTANNLLGIIAHVLLLGGVSLAVPSVWGVFSQYAHVGVSWPVLIVIFIVVLGVFTSPLRHKLSKFMKHIGQSLHAYIHQPAKIAAVILLDMLLAIIYTTVFYITIQAVGAHVSPVECFVAFSIGMLAATITPTPGGLVGAEAGLFAGLSAYGVAAPDALAATLLFRLLTAWLPALPGLAALLYARRQNWL